MTFNDNASDSVKFGVINKNVFGGTEPPTRFECSDVPNDFNDFNDFKDSNKNPDASSKSIHMLITDANSHTKSSTCITNPYLTQRKVRAIVNVQTNVNADDPSTDFGSETVETDSKDAEAESINNDNDNDTSDRSEDNDTFYYLRRYKGNHPKGLMVAYLNVNSVIRKFNELVVPMVDELVDIMCLAETRLDDTIPDSTIGVSNYKLHRNDGSKFAHGLLMYVRSDITHRRRKELEIYESGCQFIVLEIWLKKQKWFFVSVYKPPPVKEDIFVDELYIITDRILTESMDIVLLGDMNIDMRPHCSNRLKEFCDMSGFRNLIQEPTCYKSQENESLIDVILVSRPQRFNHSLVFDSGLSDFHKMIVVCTKIFTPRRYPRKIQYRSFKTFDEKKYRQDVQRIPFHIAHVFDDVNDVTWCHELMLLDVINDHAPLKRKTLKKDSVPFMNSKLRKLIHRRNQLRNKFWKFRGKTDWENYRKIRNLTNQVRKQSEIYYFRDRSNTNTNSKEFWDTFKPYLNDKGHFTSNCISLKENENIISQPEKVCETFMRHYETVADNIGKPDNFEETISQESIVSALTGYIDHPSIRLINQRIPCPAVFKFSPIDSHEVHKQMKEINVKKAIGYDNVSPYFLKAAANELATPVGSLINLIINSGIYPETYKRNVVVPVYKGKDSFNKANYRPISCCTAISKVVETLLANQIKSHMEDYFHDKLSAYRQGVGCEHVITNVIEDWKRHVDSGKVVASLLMDLSKAFDCLPHKLLVAKMHAYGFDVLACTLMASYLTDRRQRIKYHGINSEWSVLNKGVPQGSVMGPILYNVFVNDLLYGTNEDFYNYADDNTISVAGFSMSAVSNRLSSNALFCMDWFSNNLMKANPEKFQLIILSRKRDVQDISLSLCGTEIKPVKTVKLLGITIDSTITFSEHVANLCKRASRHLKILLRLSSRIALDKCKLNLFESFLLSCFMYCPIVWHFCSKTQTQKLERICHRGLRFVSGDYSSDYSVLLTRYKRNTLANERLKKIALFVYNSINGNLRNFKTVYKVNDCGYNLRGECNIFLEGFDTVRYGKLSLRYSGGKLWNTLPISWKCCGSVDDFKCALRNWRCVDDRCEKCRKFMYHQ